MKINRILYCLLLLISLVALILDNSKISLGIFIILIAIPVISLLAFIFERKYVKILINYPSTISKNSNIKYKIEISSHHPYFLGSAFLLIEFDNKTFGIVNSITKKCKFGFSGIELVLDEIAKNAGLVNVKLNNFKIYDILGLFSYKIEEDTDKNIIIIPRVFPSTNVKFLSEIKNEAEENYQELSGKYKDYSSVESIHAYHDGDMLNAVHWKLTSKFDKLMVKDFKSTSDFNPLIILNIKKEYLNDDNSIETNNYLYDIATSVMAYCVNINRPFTLLIIKDGILSYRGVESLNEFTIVINELLSTPIVDNMDELLLNHINEIENLNHNRIVFIDSVSNSFVANEFSQRVGVSELTLGTTVESLDMENYKIIAIDKDRLETTLANIVF